MDRKKTANNLHSPVDGLALAMRAVSNRGTLGISECSDSE